MASIDELIQQMPDFTLRTNRQGMNRSGMAGLMRRDGQDLDAIFRAEREQ